MSKRRFSRHLLLAPAALLLGATIGTDEISDLVVEYDIPSSSVHLMWTPLPAGVLGMPTYLGWYSPEAITPANAGSPPSQPLPGGPALDGVRNLMDWWIPGAPPSQTTYYAVGVMTSDGLLLSNNAILEGSGELAAPSGLAATTPTATTLTLSWQPSIDGAQEIQILYSIHPAPPDTPAIPLWTPVASGSRIVPLPWPGTVYSFAARVRDGMGVESPLTEYLVLGETLPPPGPASGDDESDGGGGGCGGRAPLGVPAVLFLGLLPLVARAIHVVTGNW